jgi:hypothetical protein
MPTAQFRSFEEGLALAGALVAFVATYKLFKASLLLSCMLAALSALVVAYVTFFEFTLQGNTVTYRNRFRQASFLLSHVRKVGMDTFWFGLPGHTFMFVMRRPPADVDGRFFRTGLVSWPSASSWVDAINSAIRSNEPTATTR